MDANQPITTTGTVHGKTIVLSTDPGLADGKQVQVMIVPTTPPSNWGDGIRASAGALADDWTEEDDRILQEIYESRRHSTRPLPP